MAPNSGDSNSKAPKTPGTPRTPRTPPNRRILSPPGAPRPRRTERRPTAPPSNGLMTTPSRGDSRLNDMFASPSSNSRRSHRRDSRSRSPVRDRPLSYRTRSPLSNHRQSRQSTDALLGPPIDRLNIHGTVTNNNNVSHYEFRYDSPYNLNQRFESILSLKRTGQINTLAENASPEDADDESEEVNRRDTPTNLSNNGIEKFDDNERTF